VTDFGPHFAPEDADAREMSPTPTAAEPTAPGRARCRWIGFGRSTHLDPRAAGAEAAGAALEQSDGKLLIVFAAETYERQQLLAGIEDAAPGIPMIGCTTAGEIAADGPGDASVVVMALGGPGLSVATASAADAADRLRDASADVAACFAAVEDHPHKVLLLLSDGLGGDQQEVVRGAYRVVGAGVPLVGGCAGDGLKMEATYQFHNGHVLTNAIVGAAIASDGPIGIGMRHGWRHVGEPMLVTRSESNRVYTLDDEPALDVYLNRLGAPPEAREDPAAFTRFAITHPLGLIRRSGEEVRFIGGANFADRSLGCIAEVPQGGLAWFMEGDADSVLAATDEACVEALENLDGKAPLAFVAFDCIARRGVLGEVGLAVEVERIAQHARGAPVAGFYTYGEIARTHGVRGFHNQTLVVLAFG
jgi:hypothetical protein